MHCKYSFNLRSSLVAVAGVILTHTATAQFSVLHTFAGYPTDGITCYSSPVLSGSTLYDITLQGGAYNDGTVFRINTDGSDYASLISFNGINGAGSSGSVTFAGSSSVFYGISPSGGAYNDGEIYSMNTDGSGYNILMSFNGSDGVQPLGSLRLFGNSLYGVTGQGGSNNDGVIFKINPDGGGFSVLTSFTGTNGTGGPRLSASLGDNMLYGTTQSGGVNNGGVIFRMNLDGSGYTVLKNFGGTDGYSPRGSINVFGNEVYGMTAQGGNFGDGVLYKMNLDGSGYTVLRSFSGVDGNQPRGGVTVAGNTLYGTTFYGGSANTGVLFEVGADGSNYTVLENFSGATGIEPGSAPILVGTTLYGATYGNGAGTGSIYKYSLGLPLSQASSIDPAIVTGSVTLPSPSTTVQSLDIGSNSVLTLYAGDVLTAPNGLTIEQGGLLEGSGTIVGNLVNNGTLHILLGSQIVAPVINGSSQAGTVTNSGMAVFGYGATGGEGGPTAWAIGGGSSGSSGSAPMSLLNSGTAKFLTAGTIGGNMTNTGKSIFFDGLITVEGTFTQSSTGISIFDIAGYQQSTDYSFLHITSSADLAGIFSVNLLNGFQPVDGSCFDIFQADGGITLDPNFFAQLPQGFDFQLIDNNQVLEVREHAVPEPCSELLVAVSGIVLAASRRLFKRSRA